MIFNSHSPELRDKHAFLSPSSSSWLRYDGQKLQARYHTRSSAARGTALHKLAHDAIELNVKLAASNLSLATYVRDAIGYQMSCEVLLYYSDNCFGTPDTISFRRNTLRIHDLKTGIIDAKMEQLEIYAALFCLEYGQSPFEINIELRIYQRDQVQQHFPVPELIAGIMEKIVEFDQQIQIFKGGDRW